MDIMDLPIELIYEVNDILPDRDKLSLGLVNRYHKSIVSTNQCSQCLDDGLTCFKKSCKACGGPFCISNKATKDYCKPCVQCKECDTIVLNNDKISYDNICKHCIETYCDDHISRGYCVYPRCGMFWCCVNCEGLKFNGFEAKDFCIKHKGQANEVNYLIEEGYQYLPGCIRRIVCCNLCGSRVYFSYRIVDGKICCGNCQFPEGPGL